MYSTLDDLKLVLPEDRLLELTDDENAGAFVVSPVPNAAYNRVVEAIQSADSEIDGYLGERYDTPLVTVPHMIKSVSAYLAVYRLFLRRHEMEIPKGIETLYKRMVDYLAAVQKNKVAFADLTKKTPGHYSVSKTADDEVFSDDVLEQM